MILERKLALILERELVQISPHLIRQVSAVVAILNGSQPGGMQCNLGKKLCGLCADRETETPAHILFKCKSLSENRQHLLAKIYASMPPGMATDFSIETDENRTTLFLSAFKCKYAISEWFPIMVNVSSFVYNMYRRRSVLYGELVSSQNSDIL